MEEVSSLRIMRGNCLELMKGLSANSFDAVITDPPYGTTDLEFDSIRIEWPEWWEQVNRICRPSAAIICFAAQPFVTDLINSNRKQFRYDLIWHKANAVGFLAANVRPLRAHEHILLFSRRMTQKQRREAEAFERVYNPQFTEGAPYKHKARSKPIAHYGNQKGDVDKVNHGRRYPTSVQAFRRDAVSHHPTAKPVELMRWLVRTYTVPGQKVLDPFAGSGSTGVACKLEGRGFVGMELNDEYAAITESRLT